MVGMTEMSSTRTDYCMKRVHMPMLTWWEGLWAERELPTPALMWLHLQFCENDSGDPQTGQSGLKCCDGG